MSHMAEYYKEERDETLLENEKGFISYKIYDHTQTLNRKEIMICDFYVNKDYRGTKAAKDLADEVEKIGRDQGCSDASCYIQHKGEEDMDRTTYKLQLYIRYGFKVYSMSETQITLIKDLTKDYRKGIRGE